ncbi:methyl-accepting chemotaxis protein [Shewanella sp. OPT22]|nr:methyl-accepting chemotaxis protein [Shewanella sp. OPT22]
MSKPLSIRTLVLTTLAIIFLIVLAFTLWFGSSSQRAHLEEYAQDHTHSLTKSYFDSLNTMMLTGTIGNRELLRKKMTAEEEIKDIRIIRSPALNKVFGKGLSGESVQDNFDEQALAGKTINTITQSKEGRVLTRIEPILAKADYQGVNCLGCHQVSEGTILGATRIDYSLAKSDRQLEKSLFTSALIQATLFILAFIITGFILNHFVISRLRLLRHMMTQVTEQSDLTLQLSVNRDDEIGAVSNTFNQMVSRINDTLCTVVTNAREVNESAKSIASMAETTKHEVLAQKSNTTQVATAMTEMAASAEQVKANAETTFSHSQTTSSAASDGENRAQIAVNAIETLSQEVQQGAAKIQQLNHRSDEVAAVLSVISGIAEQTNLLALNAAIEAARAGEQGRGFAVVADEVRTLASRTQESTQDIRKTIEGLREEAADCVQIMDKASGFAQQQVSAIQTVAEELKNINDSIDEICELNAQMETAASEQSHVSESINANVIDISQSAETTSIDAESTAEIANKLLGMADKLEQSAMQFRLIEK